MNWVRNTLLFCLAIGSLLGGLAAPSQAGEPFFYYPAYGAHRGKIVYRDGLLVDRQKIRWGGGITANGAAVFHDFFAAAVPIAQTALGGARELEDRGMSPEEFSRVRGIESDLQARADAMLVQTIALRRAFGIADEPIVVGPVPGPGSQQNNAVNDGFSDWEGSLNTAPTPVAPATPPQAPVPQVPLPAPNAPMPNPPAANPPATSPPVPDEPSIGVKIDIFQDWET